MDLESFARGRVSALLRTAHLLAGSSAAEDLVQDTMLELVKHWERISTMDNPEGYVYRILVNRFLSERRRRARAPAPQILLDIARPAPEAATAQWEDSEVLRGLLADLSPRVRTVIVLRYYLDLDTRAIAEAMDTSESTVRSSLARGLGSLRAQFPTEGDTDDRQT